MSRARTRAPIITMQVAAAIALYFILKWLLETFVAEELHLGVSLATVFGIVGAVGAYVLLAARNRRALQVYIGDGPRPRNVFAAFRVVMFTTLCAVIGLMIGAPELVHSIGEAVASTLNATWFS